MREILAIESKAVASIPYSEEYDKAIQLIIDRVHKKGGKLVTSGMGKAGQVALNIATTFSSTGTPSVSLHPIDAQHGDLGMIQPDDVLLLVSNSGRTAEIIDLVNLTHDLYPQVPTIVITGDAESPLAEMVDATLVTAPAQEVCPYGLTPTTSITMMTVISDILVVNVMREIGFTKSDYALRHHGGCLGEKSRD